ncbi:DnaJ sub B member 2 [Podila horticola]|nr:DnaJ sub B member 2 [Podila horticola]
MDDKPNYYELLDVDPGASKEDIKRAYRRQALLFHPDKMKPHMKDEASQHFHLISEAYEVLYDDAKRELYDRYGEEGVKAGGPPPSQSSRDPFSRPPRGYPAGGEGPGPFGGPGFGFGFGGFDFDFFGMPQHHRQFHGAFSSSSSSFPRHSRETRERMPYGEGNEWKGQKRQRQRDDYHKSVFGSNDDILQDIFSGDHAFAGHHQRHRGAFDRHMESMFEQAGFGGGFPGGHQPMFADFGTGGFTTSSTSTSSSSFSGGPRGTRTSTKTTIVNGRRTTVTDVTDAEGNTTTTVENPDGTRQTFINGTPAPAIESGSGSGRDRIPDRGATTSSGGRPSSSHP